MPGNFNLFNNDNSLHTKSKKMEKMFSWSSLNLWITELSSWLNHALQLHGSMVYCSISGSRSTQEQSTRAFTTASGGCLAIRKWRFFLGMGPCHLGHCDLCACCLGHPCHLLPVSKWWKWGLHLFLLLSPGDFCYPHWSRFWSWFASFRKTVHIKFPEEICDHLQPTVLEQVFQERELLLLVLVSYRMLWWIQHNFH